MIFNLRVEGGELFDKIISIEKYDEPTAKFLFYQMVQAIKVNKKLTKNIFLIFVFSICMIRELHTEI